MAKSILKLVALFILRAVLEVGIASVGNECYIYIIDYLLVTSICFIGVVAPSIQVSPLL